MYIIVVIELRVWSILHYHLISNVQINKHTITRVALTDFSTYFTCKQQKVSIV
jgi:hypothetical protein